MWNRFTVNNKNTRTTSMKLFLVFLLLTLNKWMLTGEILSHFYFSRFIINYLNSISVTQDLQLWVGSILCLTLFYSATYPSFYTMLCWRRSRVFLFHRERPRVITSKLQNTDHILVMRVCISENNIYLSISLKFSKS